MSEDSYPSETLDLVYNEVKDALNMQFQSMDGLNTKASVIIGFVGVIKIEEKVKYINYSLILLFVGLIVLISSIIVG
jgi:hypothetical protein